MKKLFYFSILLLVGIVYSCADSNTAVDKDQKEVKLRNLDPNFIPINIPFPEGTQFEITESAISFTLPSTHYIAGLGTDGQFYASIAGGSGSITCTCSEGSGCDPITNPLGTGCLMKSGCSQCSKSTSSIANIATDMLELAVFANESDVSITEFSQLDGSYYLPEKFLEFEAITELLTDITAGFDTGDGAEMKTVFVNLLGYSAAIEVPVESDNTSLAVVAGGGGSGDVSCSCNVSGSCPLKKHWSGTKWCESDGCTSCTMSGVSVAMDGLTHEFSITDGFISLM